MRHGAGNGIIAGMTTPRRALLTLPLLAIAGPALAQRGDDNVFRLLAVARDAGPRRRRRSSGWKPAC